MSAPILHWPKLFEGWVCGVGAYTRNGYGAATGFGHNLTGNGRSTGGYHSGNGNGGEYADNFCGDGWGDGGGWGFGDNGGSNDHEEGLR